MAQSGRTAGFTVGSLLPSEKVAGGVPPQANEGAGWSFVEGEVRRTGPGGAGAAVEPLTYSNPYGQETERVWFDGRIV